jgi:hypothetical protein
MVQVFVGQVSVTTMPLHMFGPPHNVCVNVGPLHCVAHSVVVS